MATDTADLKRRMHGAVEALKHDLVGLRTGRASTALLDPIQVEVYGANMPLNQVATVSTPEARMMAVQVWDRSTVQPVEKAIRAAGLGLNPITDGQMTRLPICRERTDAGSRLSRRRSPWFTAIRAAPTCCVQPWTPPPRTSRRRSAPAAHVDRFGLGAMLADFDLLVEVGVGQHPPCHGRSLR